MGPDPETGNPMIVKDGRFGPYVTDGEYNASLRKGDTVEEPPSNGPPNFADRRAKGPAKKKATKKKAAKKKSAKKEKSAKRATKKKAAASSDDE